MTSYLDFPPFSTRRAQPYKDANDRDDDGLAQDDGAARKRAREIVNAHREATGENPISDDDNSEAVDAAAKAFRSASTEPQRIKAAADLIVAAGKATGVL